MDCLQANGVHVCILKTLWTKLSGLLASLLRALKLTFGVWGRGAHITLAASLHHHLHWHSSLAGFLVLSLAFGFLRPCPGLLLQTTSLGFVDSQPTFGWLSS